MNISGVKLLDIPKILDKRGNLSYVEGTNHIPFIIERCHWIYDVPGGEKRGGHAYLNNQEFIVALSGSFDVIVNDGNEDKTYHLNRPYFGLYIPAMYWRQMENFSTNSLALVISSIPYDANDYIRELSEFKKMKKHEGQHRI